MTSSALARELLMQEESDRAATALQKVARGRRARLTRETELGASGAGKNNGKAGADSKAVGNASAPASSVAQDKLSAPPAESPAKAQQQSEAAPASGGGLFSWMGGAPAAEAKGAEKAHETDGHMSAGTSATGFFSSWTTDSISGPASSASTAAAARHHKLKAEGNATSMSFFQWVTELQNQVIALWERRDAEERRAFKAKEDARFNEMKRNLHQKTAVQFGNAKARVQLLHEENLQRGQEVKKEQLEMRQVVQAEREQWIHHGHEIIMQHGRDQAARTKQALAESTGMKADQGRHVRLEGIQLGKEIYQHRSAELGHKRSHVQELKREAAGKVDESMTYAYNNKKETVREVRRVEDKWRYLSKTQSATFRAHATELHHQNDKTKEHARQVHTDLVKTKGEAVGTERQLKQAHSGQIAEKRTAVESSKKVVRDAIFAARFVSSEKTKLMLASKQLRSPEKMEQTAFVLGLVDSPESNTAARATSPYRLKK